MGILAHWRARGRKLAKHAFQALGVAWVGVLILNVFLADYPWYDRLERCIVAVMLIVAAIYGVQKSRPVRSVSCRVKRTDLRVEITIGDIFAANGVPIVGTNTTFDTRMDDGTISPTSIQGQYTSRYFAAGVRDLDRQLDDALAKVEVVECRTKDQKPFGKRKVYPLGTVVPVHAGERKAYFYAMAHFNATKAAQVGTTAFLDALPGLWNGIRDHGGMENLLCPLLGAKHGRVPAKRVELIGEIVRSFIAASRDAKLSDNLTIVILPEDQKQGQIDMEKIGRWLEYECSARFSMTGSSGLPGRAIE